MQEFSFRRTASPQITLLDLFYLSQNFLGAANPAFEPIELNLKDVFIEGKLLGVWRKV